VVPAAARTRCGNKALKTAATRAPPLGGVPAILRDGGAFSLRRIRGGRWERQEGTDPERGTYRNEGNTLKSEAHGRSGAKASGGVMVDIAMGVPKPRTWYAAAKGFAAGERVHHSDIVS